MVRFDPDMVREKVALAPAEFELRARNPAHDLKFGGNRIVFASVGGPAFVSDLDNGRRPGNHEDLCNYFRVLQSLNIVHQEGGGVFESMDLPARTLVPELSGEKGWFEPDFTEARIDVAPGGSGESRSGTLTVLMSLKPSSPAVTLSDSKVLGDDFGTTDPIVRVTLGNPNRVTTGTTYGLLKSLTVKKVTLTTEVTGATGIVVQIDLFTMDPSKPFEPFGPSPSKNGWPALSRRICSFSGCANQTTTMRSAVPKSAQAPERKRAGTEKRTRRSSAQRSFSAVRSRGFWPARTAHVLASFRRESAMPRSPSRNAVSPCWES